VEIDVNVLAPGSVGIGDGSVFARWLESGSGDFDVAISFGNTEELSEAGIFGWSAEGYTDERTGELDVGALTEGKTVGFANADIDIYCGSLRDSVGGVRTWSAKSQGQGILGGSSRNTKQG
jgi:hypothetical protein